MAAPCGSHFIKDYEIASPKDAVRVLSEELSQLAHEKVMAVYINTKGRPICCQTVGIGNVNSCFAPVQSIVKMALLVNAFATVLMHNHPSSNLIPSNEDMKFTRKAKEALALVEIDLKDHIIVGPVMGEYYSFLENDLL